MAVTDLPERGVRWFDEVQQDRRWLAQPIGTIRKYADDRGSAFAGLLTFQIFLGMLPLLVVVLTVLGQVLVGSERVRDAVLDSTLGQFPVIGNRIAEDVAVLRISGWWLAVSVVGLLWTSTGIYHSMQLALNQVWNVEGVDRQGWVSRHVRASALFTMVVLAAVGTAFVRRADLLGVGTSPIANLGSAIAGAVIASFVLLGVFRIATSPVVPTRSLVPAAALAGPLWELLQHVGSWIVLDRLSQAEDLYGGIGFVVVTLFWINLLARTAVFANEWAVVSRRRLWPRRIAQPPLTDADQEVLESLVRNERRRPEMQVEVRFDEDAESDPNPDEDDDDDEQAPDPPASGDTARGAGRAPWPSRRGATTG